MTGPILLRKSLRTMTQTELSKRTGIDQGWISKLASGKKRANLDDALVLRDVLGIPPEAWSRRKKSNGR